MEMTTCAALAVQKNRSLAKGSGPLQDSSKVRDLFFDEFVNLWSKTARKESYKVIKKL